MPYVYSTISQNMTYGTWAITDRGKPNIRKEVVTINGGANVMDKRALSTPRGMVTKLTKSELEICEADPAFKRHQDKGFIVVQSGLQNANKVAKSDMTAKDNSAQSTPKDFSSQNIVAKTNNDDDEG